MSLYLVMVGQDEEERWIAEVFPVDAVPEGCELLDAIKVESPLGAIDPHGDYPNRVGYFLARGILSDINRRLR